MKSFLVTCCLLIQTVVYACGGINQQVYSGKIEYSLDPANPLICTVTITMDFDVNELVKNDSIWVDWGDARTSAIHAICITEDTLASSFINKQIYTHVYSGTHTYTSLPAWGYYLISFQNEYRLNGVSNIAEGDAINVPFNLTALVTIDTSAGAQYDPLSFPPLAIGFSGLAPYYQADGMAQINSRNDSIVYSFVTPIETISNPVPEYQYPDQFCAANGVLADTFSINPVTGDLAWSLPCQQGIFCYATCVNRYRNGQLLSSIMREQNIYVSAGIQTGVQTISGKNIMKIYPNPAQNILSGNIYLTNPALENYLEIISPDGRIIKEPIPVKNGRFETDISALDPGIYFVHLEDGEGVTKMFIKQ